MNGMRSNSNNHHDDYNNNNNNDNGYYGSSMYNTPTHDDGRTIYYGSTGTQYYRPAQVLLWFFI